MSGDGQHLNPAIACAIQDAVWKARYPQSTNIGRALDWICVRDTADSFHRDVECAKVALAEPAQAIFVESDMLQMLNASPWMEKVTHRQRA